MSTSPPQFLNQTWDDRDTNSFRYQGFWFLTGSWNATSVGDSGTLASSNDPFANVTFTFPVPAIAFYYYGIQRSRGGLYEICIDCDPNRPIWNPIDALNVTDNGANPPVVLYSQTFKVPGVHEIIIRNSNDTRIVPSGNSQITLDRIDLQVVNPNAPPPSSSTPPAATTLPPNGSGLGNNPSAAAARKADDVPIGAVVGGVLGAIAVIALMVLFGYWFMISRKRAAARAKAKANVEAGIGPETEQVIRVDPYNEPPSPPPTGTSHLRIPSDEYTSSSEQRPSTYFVIPPRKAGMSDWNARPALHPSRPSVSSSSIISGSYVSTDISSPSTQSQGAARGPRREMDGGPLPMQLEEDDEEDDEVLPPEYGQVFGRSRRNTRSARNTTTATTVSSSAPSEPIPPTPNSSTIPDRAEPKRADGPVSPRLSPNRRE